MINFESFVPAKVKYKGINTKEFTFGEIYDAYFLEYWQGLRESLHVKNNSGEISDYNNINNFEIISDPCNLLNKYEAIVECITHKFDNDTWGIKFGKEYKAISRDKDGLYLVKDESGDCYFYSPDSFKIISDKYGILDKQSVYYSYHNDKPYIPKPKAEINDYQSDLHKYSFENEEYINQSKNCGCFYCLQIFDKNEVDWIQDKHAKTALCPYCGIDSVLPDIKVELSYELLKSMYDVWF